MLQPGETIRRQAARRAESPVGGADPERDLLLSIGERPVDRCAEIFCLGIEPGDPGLLIAAGEVGFRGFGERKQAGCVRQPGVIFFRERLELFQAVITERLQHHESRVTGGKRYGADQAVADQRAQHVVGVATIFRRLTDRFDRIEGNATDEDRHPPEQCLLVQSEEVVAPGHRVAHGPQPVGHAAALTTQHLQTIAEPGQQRIRREDVHAGGGQFDGKRKAVELAANLRNRARHPVIHRQPGVDRASPLHEERDSVGS